eukprot:115163-Chlamydomonas_euryale.AAC.1
MRFGKTSRGGRLKWLRLKSRKMHQEDERASRPSLTLPNGSGGAELLTPHASSAKSHTPHPCPTPSTTARGPGANHGGAAIVLLNWRNAAWYRSSGCSHHVPHTPHLAFLAGHPAAHTPVHHMLHLRSSTPR